jgi:hypothetical protein
MRKAVVLGCGLIRATMSRGQPTNSMVIAPTHRLEFAASRGIPRLTPKQVDLSNR